MVLNIGFFLAEGNTGEIPTFIHVLFLILNAAVGFAGIMLWKNKPVGLILSIIVQSMHLISFDIIRLAYRFTGIVDLFIGFRVGDGSLDINGHIGGRYALNYFDEGGAFMMAINIIALVFLVILLKAKKENKLIE